MKKLVLSILIDNINQINLMKSKVIYIKKILKRIFHIHMKILIMMNMDMIYQWITKIKKKISFLKYQNITQTVLQTDMKNIIILITIKFKFNFENKSNNNYIIKNKQSKRNKVWLIKKKTLFLNWKNY